MSDQFIEKRINPTKGNALSRERVSLVNRGLELLKSAPEIAEIPLRSKSWIPHSQGGKWGFIDRDGKSVVDFLYDLVSQFFDGFAVVAQDSKFGLINEFGILIADFAFDLFTNFSEGFIAAKQEGKWGFISENGTVAVDFVYEAVSRFSEGLAAVKYEGKWGYIDKSGNTVVDFIYDTAKDFSEGLAGAFFGDPITKPGPNLTEIIVGLEKVFAGYINDLGEIVIEFEYVDVHSFSNGLASVSKRILSEPSEWIDAVIDKNGKEVSGFNYESLSYISEGLIGARLNRKWGFVNLSGDVVIEFLYEEVSEFKDGFAACRIDEKWGFIDKAGRQISDFVYAEVSEFSEGLAAVRSEEKWGFIGTSGKVVIELIYDYVFDFFNGVSYVEVDYESEPFNFGYIETDGTEHLTGVSFDEWIEGPLAFYYDAIIEGGRSRMVRF